MLSLAPASAETQLAFAFARQLKTRLNHARTAPDRRSARRISNVDWARIVVDGSSASLIDLSVLGAQVVSLEIIRPGRLLEVVLEGNGLTVRCRARIVWSAFDVLQPTRAACYRAGLEFEDACRPRLERLCSGRMLSG